MQSFAEEIKHLSSNLGQILRRLNNGYLILPVRVEFVKVKWPLNVVQHNKKYFKKHLYFSHDISDHDYFKIIADIAPII